MHQRGGEVHHKKITLSPATLTFDCLMKLLGTLQRNPISSNQETCRRESSLSNSNDLGETWNLYLLT